MILKKLIAAISLVATTISGVAQDINKLINQADVERIIKTLSADDMQGRAIFSPGIEKAAQFIESAYRQAGLKPMEGNTGYRQNFSMIKTIPVKQEVSINGVNIAPENIDASGNASFSWNTLNDAEIVRITPGQDLPEVYYNYAQSGRKLLVLVDPVFQGLFKRIRAYNQNGNIPFKCKTENQGLVFVLGRFDNVKSFSVNYEAKNGARPLFNIAGIIPGKTRPDEYVIFSAHYDHLGIISSMKGDSIANGADDDASGTTAVIALANYYKKLDNNARTLLFVAFTAEEACEYGSRYFAKTINPDKVVAMFNIEMIGKASKFGLNSAFITGFSRSDFGTILQKNLEGSPFKFYADPYPDQDLFYKSDNAPLAELGVPAHTISTDQMDIDKYYHTVKDEFSTLDIANITATIKAIALSAIRIVSGKDTPKRVPKLHR